MGRIVRDLIYIDEDLCDGCGQCILSCAEGALQLIDGKAKLVSENLCDGFGNCVGDCPQDAITIAKQKADEFDEAIVEEHLKTFKPDVPASLTQDQPSPAPQPAAFPIAGQPAAHAPQPHAHGGGCPGSAMRSFQESQEVIDDTTPADEIKSTLTQWPVQLMLVPPTAPFLKDREILLAADCCPFAFADFHRQFLKGKSLLVGCPKLDDINHYQGKLEETFRLSGCTGVTVMTMEVPCCSGLNIITREAIKACGRDIPLTEVVVGIRGELLSKTVLA